MHGSPNELQSEFCFSWRSEDIAAIFIALSGKKLQKTRSISQTQRENGPLFLSRSGFASAVQRLIRIWKWFKIIEIETVKELTTTRGLPSKQIYNLFWLQLVEREEKKREALYWKTIKQAMTL